MKPRVAIIGASGHGIVLADAVLAGSVFELGGFFDDVGASCVRADLPGSFLGTTIESQMQLATLGIEGIFLGIGDNFSRQKCWERLKGILPEVYFPALVHPRAVVSASARLANGAVVLAGAMVGPSAEVGEFALLNTGSSLDHHGKMGRFSSLAPSAFTGGCVQVGEGTAIGMGAQVIHGRRIGANSVVGAGSVVLRDIPEDSLAFGVPARVIRQRVAGERYL